MLTKLGSIVACHTHECTPSIDIHISHMDADGEPEKIRLLIFFFFLFTLPLEHTMWHAIRTNVIRYSFDSWWKIWMELFIELMKSLDIFLCLGTCRYRLWQEVLMVQLIRMSTSLQWEITIQLLHWVALTHTHTHTMNQMKCVSWNQRANPSSFFKKTISTSTVGAWLALPISFHSPIHSTMDEMVLEMEMANFQEHHILNVPVWHWYLEYATNLIYYKHRFDSVRLYFIESFGFCFVRIAFESFLIFLFFSFSRSPSLLNIGIFLCRFVLPYPMCDSIYMWAGCFSSLGLLNVICMGYM